MCLFCLLYLERNEPSQPGIRSFLSVDRKSKYSQNSSEQIRKADALINNLIIGCGLPVSIVENPFFVSFCAEWDVKFTIPSRHHISKKEIPNRAAEVRNNVKQQLAEASNVSLTIDIWTDRRCHSFLAATAHTFVHCEPKSYLLDFVSFQGSHTGQRIAETIDHIVEANDLRGKLMHIVTDNAANMRRAITLVNDLVEDSQDNEDEERQSVEINNAAVLDDESLWENLNEDDEQLVNQATDRNCISRLACFAHSLQLVVKDGLDATGGSKGQNVKTSMGKCVKMSSLCHQSTHFREEFENAFGQGRSVPVANTTRWSSTHTQLKAVINLDSNKLTDVLRRTGQQHLVLSLKDTAMLKELIDILEPFAEATELTQGSMYCTVGCVVPCIVGLYKCLSTSKQVCKYNGKVVAALLKSLTSRFDGLLSKLHILDEDENETNGFGEWIYPMAALLDPSYGYVWLEVDLPCDETIKQELLESLRNMITREAIGTCNQQEGNIYIILLFILHN